MCKVRGVNGTVDHAQYKTRPRYRVANQHLVSTPLPLLVSQTPFSRPSPTYSYDEVLIHFRRRHCLRSSECWSTCSGRSCRNGSLLLSVQCWYVQVFQLFVTLKLIRYTRIHYLRHCCWLHRRYLHAWSRYATRPLWLLSCPGSLHGCLHPSSRRSYSVI